MAGLNEIPSFQTLSRRERVFHFHAINRKILFLYYVESIAAIGFFKIHTCKYSTAVRIKYWRNYRDAYSGWSKTTKV